MTEEVITSTETPIEPSWFIDDGIPGSGDRPAWLHEKFKTAADLAKSYHELEKKVGTAPDEYDISNSKFLDADYEHIQDFLKLAKEKRVPKDVVDKMVDSIDKYMNEFTIDYHEEAKKLGDNAKERLTVLDNWAKANLSEASYHALTHNLKNADAIKALEELRSKMMSNNVVVPNGNAGGADNGASLEDLKTELSNNLAKYKSDPNYRRDLQGRLEVAAKASNIIDKVGY
jgi:hypothetical protein